MRGECQPFPLMAVVYAVMFSADLVSTKWTGLIRAGKNVELNATMFNAARAGDMETVEKFIKDGILEEYIGDMDEDDVRRLDRYVSNKVVTVKNLLAKSTVSVVSEEFFKEHQNDGKVFEVSYLPGTVMKTALLLNLTAIKEKRPGDDFNHFEYICRLLDVDTRVVENMLDSGFDVNERFEGNWTALMLAAQKGDLSFVKFLVRKGAEINAIFPVPMDMMYKSSYGRYMDLFSKMEGEPPVLYAPLLPIHLAAIDGHREVVLYLLSRGATLINPPITWIAVLFSLHRGNTETVKALLDHGVGVNLRDIWGATPLNHASGAKTLDVVKLLMSRGAAVKVKDIYGWGPVHAAAFKKSKKNKEFLELFLNAEGSLINEQTDGGFTPLNLLEAGRSSKLLQYLQKCTSANCTEDERDLGELDSDGRHAGAVRFLLERGARVDHQDRMRGWSTLHWAAASGDLRVAKILLEEYRAKINAKTKEGDSPLDLARRFGMSGVAKYLMKKVQH